MGAPPSKRDCTCNHGADSYTVLGNTVMVDDQTQNGTAMIEISHEVSVGYTTTFSAGVNFEVFSAGFEFSIEQTVSDTLSYTYEVQDGQAGVAPGTPILTCWDGNTSGCSDDDNGDGTFYYATRGDKDQPVGQYAPQTRA